MILCEYHSLFLIINVMYSSVSRTWKKIKSIRINMIKNYHNIINIFWLKYPSTLLYLKRMFQMFLRSSRCIILSQSRGRTPLRLCSNDRVLSEVSRSLIKHPHLKGSSVYESMIFLVIWNAHVVTASSRRICRECHQLFRTLYLWNRRVSVYGLISFCFSC